MWSLFGGGGFYLGGGRRKKASKPKKQKKENWFGESGARFVASSDPQPLALNLLPSSLQNA